MARRPTMPPNSSSGLAAICRRMPSPRCVTRCSAVATATGSRPISRSRASSTNNWPRTVPAAPMSAARATRATISMASSNPGSDLNSDWLATYQSIPRFIDEQLAAHGASSAYVRGEGDARDDLDGQFESWFAKLRPLAVKQLGIDTSFDRSADDEPLYKIEPVAPTAVNTIVALGGVAPMKMLVNKELQNKL